jgi:2OG-Fe(II) oxygenase superfamily
MSAALLQWYRHHGTSSGRRPLYSHRPYKTGNWTTVSIPNEEKSRHTLICEGGTLWIESNAVAKETCSSVFEEICHPTKQPLWRRYPMQGTYEMRIHLLLHAAGLTPIDNFINFQKLPTPTPGYKHGLITMASVSLNAFQRASELVDTISKLFFADRYFWNCGLDIVLFRNGADRIEWHADNTQDETDVYSIILYCEHDRVVRFFPDPEGPPSDLEEFELYLRSGDSYYMNGELQASYVHSVEEAENVSDFRAVMVCRRGNHKIVDRDSGQPVPSLYFPLSWHYSMSDIPELVEGHDYTFRRLYEFRCFRYSIGSMILL